MTNPVPTGSAHGLVFSNTFPPRPLEVGGDRHDAVSTALEKVLDGAPAKSAAIEKRFMRDERLPERIAAARADFASAATIVAPLANDWAKALNGVRERNDLGRRIGPNDVYPNTADRFYELDLTNRIALARAEIIKLAELGTADMLGRAIRDAFDPDDSIDRDKINLVTPYAIDTLPPFLLERVESIALVKIDTLRADLLARLDKTGAGDSMMALDYLADALHYNLQATARGLEKVWGTAASVEGGGGGALDPVIATLQRALRREPRAA